MLCSEMKLELFAVLYFVSMLLHVQSDVEAAAENVTMTSVSVTVGEIAQLNCTVKLPGDRQIIWMRKRDYHILTVGMITYADDHRFRVRHDNGTDIWTLLIRRTALLDSAVYACQTEDTSDQRQLFNLTVIEPTSQILGGSVLYFGRGSTINVTCVINKVVHHVVWKFENDIISCDNPRGGLTMTTLTSPGMTVSTLLLPRAEDIDSGLYQCTPTDVRPATVNVHVSEENAVVAETVHDSGTTVVI